MPAFFVFVRFFLDVPEHSEYWDYFDASDEVMRRKIKEGWDHLSGSAEITDSYPIARFDDRHFAELAAAALTDRMARLARKASEGKPDGEIGDDPYYASNPRFFVKSEKELAPCELAKATLRFRQPRGSHDKHAPYEEQLVWIFRNDFDAALEKAKGIQVPRQAESPHDGYDRLVANKLAILNEQLNTTNDPISPQGPPFSGQECDGQMDGYGDVCNAVIGSQKTESKALKPSEERAYSQFQFAMLQQPGLKTDDEVYDWLKTRADIEGESFPSKSTWKRQLRAARKFKSDNKNTPRTMKSVGSKSVVRDHQI